jgi:hypothetical protein
MNAEQVVKLANFNARELGLKWIVTKSRDIRLKRGNREYCPIEVAGNFEDFSEASKDLGLNWLLETLVMCAADDITTANESDTPAKSVVNLRQFMLMTFDFGGPHVAN